MKSLIMRRPQVAVLRGGVWAPGASEACADTMAANPPGTSRISVLSNANGLVRPGEAPDSSVARAPVITPSGFSGRVHGDRLLRSAHHCGQRYEANL